MEAVWGRFQSIPGRIILIAKLLSNNDLRFCGVSVRVPAFRWGETSAVGK